MMTNNPMVTSEVPHRDRRTQLKVSPHYISHVQFHTEVPIERRRTYRDSLNIDLACEQKLRRISEDSHALDLCFEVRTGQGTKVIYRLALIYSALVNVLEPVEDDEKLRTALFVNAPSIVYPFARSAIANLTREAGFFPLELEPINFYTLYLKRRESLLKEALP